jgi:hypothetical protein
MPQWGMTDGLGLSWVAFRADGRGRASLMSVSAGPGRRVGKTPETLAMERHFWELNTKYRLSVKTIAEINNLSESRVFDMVREARAAAAEAESKAQAGGTAAATESQPRPLRAMSRRTLLPRAWDHAERNAVPSLSLAATDF